MMPWRGPARGTFVGITTLDLIYEVERVPRSNEKLRAVRQTVAAGGPAANAAVAFSALGGSATLVSCLGAGPLAEAARADLRAHGVALADCAAPGESGFPVASILVSAESGDRAVVALDGRGRAVQIRPEALVAVRGADVLLCDGNYLELALAAAGEARAHRVPTVLDGGSWKEGLSALLPLVEVAICSADFTLPAARGDAAVLDGLLAQGVRLACITHGAEPIAWRTAQRCGEPQGGGECPRAPEGRHTAGEPQGGGECPRAPEGRHTAGELAVPAVSVVDTLAAGDIFHGSFCYALATRGPEAAADELLAFAAEIASFSTTFFGSREWIAARAGKAPPTDAPF